MRNRYKNSRHYPAVAEAIGRNYAHLYALCCHGKSCYYHSRDVEDIFQDTVVYVIRDKEALNKLNSDFISHFLHRFRMIEFQTMQDARELKAKQYANYQQAEEDTNQAW